VSDEITEIGKALKNNTQNPGFVEVNSFYGRPEALLRKLHNE